MTPRDERLVIRLALACFVLAGLTGLLFRFALANGWGPGSLAGLTLGNIRHAHSHLMFFSWATPLVMLLIMRARAALGDEVPRGMTAVLLLVIGLGLLAYPPFMLWGYSFAQIGERELPLGMITSGLNAIGWYAFAILYVRMPRSPAPRRARLFCDLAVGLLVLSTIPAWGLATSAPLGHGGPIVILTLVHAYLDTFAEGWFVVGVLAVAASQFRPKQAPPIGAVVLLALSIPLLFPLSLPMDVLWPGAHVMTRLAGLTAGVALLWMVHWLWHPAAGSLWRVALAMLALKAGALVTVGLTPWIDWASLPGMRVLYLHLGLVGFVSVGLVAAVFEERPTRVFAIAASLLVVTLLPLTAVWPAALAGVWIYHLAAWASIPLVLMGGWLMVEPLEG